MCMLKVKNDANWITPPYPFETQKKDNHIRHSFHRQKQAKTANIRGTFFFSYPHGFGQLRTHRPPPIPLPSRKKIAHTTITAISISRLGAHSLWYIHSRTKKCHLLSWKDTIFSCVSRTLTSLFWRCISLRKASLLTFFSTRLSWKHIHISPHELFIQHSSIVMLTIKGNTAQTPSWHQVNICYI